jgi:hypothetical protein
MSTHGLEESVSPPGSERVRRLSGRAVMGLFTVIAVLAAGAGVAIGTGLAATATINGCVTKANGALRVIYPSKGQSCTSKESALKWNEQGPAGAAGKAGATILSGSGKPSTKLGVAGDYYIDTATHDIYGPAIQGQRVIEWGSATSLVGPPGKPATTVLPLAYRTTNGLVELPSGDTENVITQTIPKAGSYSVIATVDVDNTGTKSTAWDCYLDYANPNQAGENVDTADVDVPGSLGSSTAFNNNTETRLTLVGVVATEANATLTVDCGEGHALEDDQVSDSELITTQLSGFTSIPSS